MGGDQYLSTLQSPAMQDSIERDPHYSFTCSTVVRFEEGGKEEQGFENSFVDSSHFPTNRIRHTVRIIRKES